VLVGRRQKERRGSEIHLLGCDLRPGSCNGRLPGSVAASRDLEAREGLLRPVEGSEELFPAVPAPGEVGAVGVHEVARGEEALARADGVLLKEGEELCFTSARDSNEERARCRRRM